MKPTNIRRSYENIGFGTPDSLRIKNFVDPLDPFLSYQGFVMLDGGLATELERRGADLKDPLWSAKYLIENPKLIQQVHEDYIRAGADIISTSSYQASFQALEDKGFNEQESKELFELSVKLAKQAVENTWETMKDSVDPGGISVSNTYKRLKPLVAASLGPYGSFEGSEYVGNYGKSIKQLMDFHRPRIHALLAGEPDLLLLETIPCANEETHAFERLLKHEFTNVPTIMSFSCRDGQKVNCGENFEDAVKIVDSIHNVVAIGINCTSPLYISDLLKWARSVTTKPLVVYPNKGEVWDTTDREWKGTSIALSEKALEWYQIGARGFGGCCRTQPEDIVNMREKLIQLRK